MRFLILGPTLPALAALCVALGSSLSSQPAQAQTAPPSRAQVLLFSSEQRILLTDRSRPCVAPARLDPVASDAAPLVEMTAEGQVSVSSAELAAAWTPFKGQPADAQALAPVGRRIGCLYAAHGLIAPDVTVSTTGTPGRWRLRIDEPRIVAVAVRGETSDRTRAVVMRTFAALVDKVGLSEADIWRGVETLHRLQIWSVDARLEPTAAGRGRSEAVLVISLPEPRTSVYASLQNFSAPSVGRWSVGESTTFHNLTPLGETTTLGLFRGATSNRQEGAQLSTIALVGGSILGADVSVFRQKPEEPGSFPETLQTTSLARLQLDRPIAVGRTWASTLRLGFEAVDQSVDYRSGGAAQRDHLRALFAGVQFDHKRPGFDGFVSIMGRKGVDFAGASRPGDPRLSRASADPQAFDARLTAAMIRRFGAGEVFAQVRAQWADRSLLAFEQLNWGGFDGGRGLVTDAFLADRGIAATIEARLRPRALSADLQAQPFLFVEGARGDDVAGGRSQHALFAGPGLLFIHKGRTRLELAYAGRLGEVDVLNRRPFGDRIAVRLSTGF